MERLTPVVYCTSFSPQGYATYAHAMLASYHQHMGESNSLMLFYEGEKPPIDWPHEAYNLLNDFHCSTFIERYKDDLVVHGKKESRERPWQERWRRQGYNFKLDAWKFSRKVFAVRFAVTMAAARKAERLVWVDADVLFQLQLPDDMIFDLCPTKTDITYIPRKDYPPETGFVIYNLTSNRAHAFCHELAHLYTYGGFRELREWHDAWVFQWLIEHTPAINTSAILSQHHRYPVEHSELAPFLTHKKGNLKEELRNG